jgi:hypothetical protein
VLRLLTLLVVAFAACGDDEIIPPDQPVADAAGTTFDAGPPPPLRAEASATADGAGAERVECTLWLDITDVVSSADGWAGTSAGEVIRRSLDGEELLFEFSALLAGPVTLTGTGGAIEARLVGDQPEDAAPFWISLEAISGGETAAFTWEGTWTCSPILPDDPGAGDLDLDAPGTWTIAPAT